MASLIHYGENQPGKLYEIYQLLDDARKKMRRRCMDCAMLLVEKNIGSSSASYALDFAQHVAGITNGIADSLSRKNQPGKSYELHHLLKDAREDAPQVRDSSWWKSKSAGVGLLEWSRSFD